MESRTEPTTLEPDSAPAAEVEHLNGVDGDDSELTTGPEEEFSPALLFLEDFVVTALLSAGRPLRNGELAQKAEAQGWTLNRPALREALAASKRVQTADREWEATWRLTRRHLPREERLRVPVEALVREFLELIGKPLPVPVIAREVSAMRNAPDSNIKEAVATILRMARYALEVAPGVYLHESFALVTGAPREDVLIRENRLHLDPDFEGLTEFAQIESKDPANIARELMEFTGGPLSQKVIGFFVARVQGATFSTAKLAGVLNDRTQFQPLLNGFVMLQEAVPSLKEAAQEFLVEVGGEAEAIDPEALLRQRVPAKDVILPSEEALVALRDLGRNAEGEPIHTAKIVLNNWDVEPDDPTLVAQIQGLNEALRRDTTNWMPFGMGRFLLLESVPAAAREVPAALKPATATVRNRTTGENFDLEMDDEGLDSDGAAFVHSPEWDDIGEENEVEGARGAANITRVPVLNHHYETGTLRIRKMDEGVWDLKSPFSHLTLYQRGDGDEAPFEVWAARENGLVSGEALKQWFNENLGPSGGVAKIEREGDKLFISREPFDSRVFLTERRVEDLEGLRASAAFLSLYELLVKILSDSKSGLELPALWANVNVVRRTSKRLLVSVLSLYSPFVSKQRGQNSWVWTMETGKDADFKKGKRRFVRE
ncbi:hypothetical protein IAD21_02314 [Abditibacteriota bacterium]|nr:hypothetical protein IAD21_02314 [Abditibacteriota bacterium]